MQAIQTKYLTCTGSRGARIKAWCASGSITIPYPHELSGGDVYRAAADALCTKLAKGQKGDHWLADKIGAGLPDGSFVFVFDGGRLAALRGIVNDIRKASWSGNPWCKKPFTHAVDTIGAAYGHFGPGTCTTDEEIAQHLAQKGA